MGIHDRDYYRNEGRSLFDGVGRWGVSVWLIIATCGVYFVQLLTRDIVGGQDLTAAGRYSGPKILAGEVWRLVTPVFLHDPANLFPLAFNMLTLFWFGRRMEEVYGPRRFVLVYVTAGVLGLVLTFLGQAAGLPLPVPALGAGAAVTAVFVLFACHYPKETVYLFGILPVQAWVLALVFVGLNLSFDRNGWLVHLVGAAFGFVYFRASRAVEADWWAPRPKAAHRPQLRVVRAEPPETDEEDEPLAEPRVTAPAPRAAPAGDEHLEARLDGVLEKVSRYGQQSLTPEEREILFRASELYKRRRK